MGLLDRGTIHPKFITHTRLTWRGMMVAKGKLYRTTADPVGTVNWTPFDPDPANRLPMSVNTGALIYEGPCRVQPNVDWRARSNNTRDQTVTDFAFRVEIDFEANEVGGGLLPIIKVDDVFRVTELPEDGDPQLLVHTFLVRVMVPSTTAWTRVLLCDVNMNQVA